MAKLTLRGRPKPFVPPENSYLLATGEQRHVRVPQRIWLTPNLVGASMLVTGQTGSGKTKCLEYLLRQYLLAGQPFCLIDLHGDLSTELRRYLGILAAAERAEITSRITWLDAGDPLMTATINPLAARSPEQAATQLLEVVAACRRHWSDSWGPRLESLLLNTLALLQAHDLTLCEAPLVLGDGRVRARLLADERVAQPQRDYFQFRYDRLPKRDQVTVSESTLNKVGAFLTDHRVRTMLGATRPSLDPHEALASGQTVICRLPRGELVEHAELVASLVLASFHTAALARVSEPADRRRPYQLVLDEAQVASESFPQLLAGGRAFGIGAVAGVQQLGQLSPALAESLLGNCRVRVAFRAGRADAERLAKELFRVDGDHVKHQDRDLLGSRKSRPMFWSTTEEWEYAIRELQDQEPGECVIGLDRSPPWYAETLPVSPANPSRRAEEAVIRALRPKQVLRGELARAIKRRRAQLTAPDNQKGGSDGRHPDDAIEPLV